MKMNNPSRKETEEQVKSAISNIFGNKSFSISITRYGRQFSVCVSYQDFITETRLIQLLNKVCACTGKIIWEMDRSMSDHARSILLNDLYQHPDHLYNDTSLCGNVRRYVIDRFTTTDF